MPRPALILAIALVCGLSRGVSGFIERRVKTPSSSLSAKIVVVGGGIGGISSALDARYYLRPKEDEVTVVSDRLDFQFTPSNPWIAVRKRTPKEISLSLKGILPRHGIHFIHGKASRLNPMEKELQLDDGSKLEYDYLIIATGPRLAFDEIQGCKEEGIVSSICTTPHASQTAIAIDALVADPGPVVVGATQGASCFGPAYEFAFLLHNELYRKGGMDLVKQCPITFVTSEPYIGHLGLKGAGTSHSILTNIFRRKGIPCLTNSVVENVTSDSVYIKQMQEGEIPTSKCLPSKLTMLIPPFRGQDIWKEVPNLTDGNGMIKINEHQQSTEYASIFGVGVCVSIPPIDKTLVPTGAPKTGYMIESQGTAAVQNIRTMINHAEKQKLNNAASVTFSNAKLHSVPLLNGLCITDFGDDGAIFVTMPQYPPRRTDVTLHGKVAVLAKIAFEKYFLHKIESGDADPYYEKWMLQLVGINRVKQVD